jgi:hypothetical protein
MYMPVTIKSLAIVLLFLLPAVSLKAEPRRARVPGTYSNLQFNEDGGDLLGMEIKIVPIGDHFQAVVLVSEGEPQPMVVVVVSVHGNSLGFSVPGKDRTSWKFSGQVSPKSLTGTISYAQGGVEKVVLPRQCGYWDR